MNGVKFRVGGARGVHSEFWRHLSYRVGDEHASRICRLLDIYCWLFGVNVNKFYSRVPGG